MAVSARRVPIDLLISSRYTLSTSISPRTYGSRPLGIRTTPSLQFSSYFRRRQQYTRSTSASTNTSPQSATTTSSSATAPKFTPFKSTSPTPPAPQSIASQTSSLADGLADNPIDLPADNTGIDWSKSFHGLSTTAFSPEAAAILQDPISPNDVEIKPDGIVYLPEIKYRRILNRAFGPGAWGLAPRGETIITAKTVTREYGLVVHGRLVSLARGEQQYFDVEGIPTATEGCKSNALMRCCKDLGVASELWDPSFIRGFMKQHSKQIWVEHAVTKKRKTMTVRKDAVGVAYPFKEVKGIVGS